jgi:hypothetical protein
MFKGLFGKKSNNFGNGKTGIYRIEEKILTELLEQPGNGSINHIIQKIGFDPTQIHTIHAFDSSIIEVIGVKIFTQEPVFVLGKNKNSKIDLKTLTRELKNIDWSFEYSSHIVEDILTEGIKKHTLSFEYLNTVLKLQKESNSLYNAPFIGLYLNFKDNYLESYTSSDWSNAASKWLIDANKLIFDNMLSEAMQFHRNEIEAMEEVNMQCEALQRIPHAIKNEFIPLHRKPNGNINFYNLLAAHYNDFDNESIQIEEFKTVNKGRFIMRNELALEVDGFIFQFDSNGLLTGSTQK